MDTTDFEIFCLANGVDFSRINSRPERITVEHEEDDRDPIKIAIEKQTMSLIGPGTNAALEHFWKHAIEESIDPEQGVVPNTFFKDSSTITRPAPEQIDPLYDLAIQSLQSGLALQRMRGDVALPVHPSRSGAYKTKESILQKNCSSLSATAREPRSSQQTQSHESAIEPANPRFPSKSRLPSLIQHLHDIFVGAGATADNLEELADILATLMAGVAVDTILEAKESAAIAQSV